MLPQIASLRFSYEQRLFQHIYSDKHLEAVLNGYAKNRNFNISKRYLLGHALKLTESLLPELYQLYQNCLKIVGQHLQGDLYVQQQSDYNAGVYAVGNRFDLVLSSGIVKDFQAAEIAFVIGHELGHVLFEHNQIPVQLILSEEQQINYDLARILLQWSRSAEISADRIGLLCSGSLTSAANVFFKTSSGLSVDKENEIINALRNQYEEIAKLAFSSHDYFNTHPLIPIRFKSLELICLDIMSMRNQKNSAKTTWLHIDKTIEDVLLNTELLGLNQLQLSRQKIYILILSLLYIAISDGEINQYETSFIQEIKARIAPDLDVQEVLAFCRLNKNKFKTEVIKEIELVQVNREEATNILQISYYLATCDQPICSSEENALAEICQLLGYHVSLQDLTRE
ncbi:M48 family metallopeptidase [Gloeocapsa sp. PCC 73106]|uniref:M48 family metallopeptidase n=1 Tax=Gloeocapsa sp. PCC 73106 TaxID=102232 RepID=UPI0002ACBA88|nr:M48 family metalloprotease [Gloeocapsa sp. PCC 73106]ELR98535.1 Zn-dependent protease with chaperone function [Gloeocapsa sp. PCC 73106]